MTRCRTPSLVLAAWFVTPWSCIGTAPAQAPPPAETGPVVPMTTDETRAVEQAVLSDARVRAIVGEVQPRIITTILEPDKAEAEAFLAGRSAAPPRRRVSIVLLNQQTNQAAHALCQK